MRGGFVELLTQLTQSTLILNFRLIVSLPVVMILVFSQQTICRQPTY
jgi:hypothetical protein